MDARTLGEFEGAVKILKRSKLTTTPEFNDMLLAIERFHHDGRLDSLTPKSNSQFIQRIEDGQFYSILIGMLSEISRSSGLQQRDDLRKVYHWYQMNKDVLHSHPHFQSVISSYSKSWARVSPKGTGGHSKAKTKRRPASSGAGNMNAPDRLFSLRPETAPPSLNRPKIGDTLSGSWKSWRGQQMFVNKSDSLSIGYINSHFTPKMYLASLDGPSSAHITCHQSGQTDDAPENEVLEGSNKKGSDEDDQSVTGLHWQRTVPSNSKREDDKNHLPNLKHRNGYRPDQKNDMSNSASPICQGVTFPSDKVMVDMPELNTNHVISEFAEQNPLPSIQGPPHYDTTQSLEDFYKESEKYGPSVNPKKPTLNKMPTGQVKHPIQKDLNGAITPSDHRTSIRKDVDRRSHSPRSVTLESVVDLAGLVSDQMVLDREYQQGLVEPGLRHRLPARDIPTTRRSNPSLLDYIPDGRSAVISPRSNRSPESVQASAVYAGDAMIGYPVQSDYNVHFRRDVRPVTAEMPQFIQSDTTRHRSQSASPKISLRTAGSASGGVMRPRSTSSLSYNRGSKQPKILVPGAASHGSSTIHPLAISSLVSIKRLGGTSTNFREDLNHSALQLWSNQDIPDDLPPNLEFMSITRPATVHDAHSETKSCIHGKNASDQSSSEVPALPTSDPVEDLVQLGRARSERGAGDFEEGTSSEAGSSNRNLSPEPRDLSDEMFGGTPREGELRSGTPREGEVGSETPREGELHSGTPREGGIGSGTPRKPEMGSGTPRERGMGSGTSREGEMGSETPREGEMGSEIPREGEMGSETSREGEMGSETSREGEMGSETSREGGMGSETPREGGMGSETPKEGEMGKGTPREGEMDSGIPREGEMGSETPREGKMGKGTPREGEMGSGSLGDGEMLDALGGEGEDKTSRETVFVSETAPEEVKVNERGRDDDMQTEGEIIDERARERESSDGTTREDGMYGEIEMKDITAGGMWLNGQLGQTREDEIGSERARSSISSGVALDGERGIVTEAVRELGISGKIATADVVVSEIEVGEEVIDRGRHREQGIVHGTAMNIGGNEVNNIGVVEGRDEEVQDGRLKENLPLSSIRDEEQIYSQPDEMIDGGLIVDESAAVTSKEDRTARHNEILIGATESKDMDRDAMDGLVRPQSKAHSISESMYDKDYYGLQYQLWDERPYVRAPLVVIPKIRDPNGQPVVADLDLQACTKPLTPRDQSLHDQTVTICGTRRKQHHSARRGDGAVYLLEEPTVERENGSLEADVRKKPLWEREWMRIWQKNNSRGKEERLLESKNNSSRDTDQSMGPEKTTKVTARRPQTPKRFEALEPKPLKPITDEWRGRPLPDITGHIDEEAERRAFERKRAARKAVEISKLFSKEAYNELRKMQKQLEWGRWEKRWEEANAAERNHLRHLMRKEAALLNKPAVMDGTWEAHYTKQRKSLKQMKKRQLKTELKRTNMKSKREKEYLKRVGASLDIWDIFREGRRGTTKTERKKAAVIIQKYVRGWLVRRQFEKIKQQSRVHATSYSHFVDYYSGLMTKVARWHGVKSPTIHIDLKEVENFMDKKRYYETMFAQRAYPKKTLEYEELGEFFKSCDLYPTQREMYNSVLAVTKKTPDNPHMALTEEQISEIAFMIYVPEGSRLDKTKTRQSTWLNPLIDGKEANKFIGSDEYHSAKLSISLQVVFDAHKERLERASKLEDGNQLEDDSKALTEEEWKKRQLDEWIRKEGERERYEEEKRNRPVREGELETNYQLGDIDVLDEEF